MRDDKIFAGIVTYNPNLEILMNNIDSLLDQVELIVVYDNASNNINDLIKCVEKINKLRIVKSKKNMGIAYALNRLMEYGEEKNFSKMLTLDQDSYCTKNYVSNMESFFSMGDLSIGIVAPTIRDKDTKAVIGHYSPDTSSYVKTCISSGSIVDIKVWREVGQYDEYMFIDNVDIDFCYRVRKNGYKIVQANRIDLYHKVGNFKKKKIMGISVKVYGHSAFRKYYIARNNIYCPLKNKMYFKVLYGNYKNISLLLKIITFEDDKLRKIGNVFRGWKDGYKVR